MSEQPWTPRNTVLAGAAAAARLAEFGLRPEFFTQAQARGDEQRSRCRPEHPRTFPGQVMWAETTAALRGELLRLDRGWQLGSSRNYETVFNAEVRMAISVLGGDMFTGVRGIRAPKAAHPRGPVTSNRISHNFTDQYVLPLDGLELPVPTDQQCQTWFFLINARDETLYSELSLASDVGVDRRIGGWAERILLPEMPMPGAVTPVQLRDDDDEPATVHVGRR
ncbi:MAG TPA: hypothetical protein VMU51_23245 [Mycobacteriales bacterium]|nr:hypothetical protein [Mycobacteriales bacterium]